MQASAARPALSVAPMPVLKGLRFWRLRLSPVLDREDRWNLRWE